MKSLGGKEDFQQLLSSYDTWLFDCDGVLWHGDRLIDGAVEVLKFLRSQSMWLWFDLHPDHSLKFQSDKSIIFVTNNATKSRKSYKSKFDKLGVEAHVVGELSLASGNLDRSEPT